MYLVLYITVAILFAMLVAALLPRPFCLAIGLIFLILGILVPLAIWGYSAQFVKGDPSAYGMMGTICVILFAPAGITITILALLKGD